MIDGMIIAGKTAAWDSGKFASLLTSESSADLCTQEDTLPTMAWKRFAQSTIFSVMHKLALVYFEP